MSQEPEKKRTSKRHLTIETMETRLLLSISPAGPGCLKELIEVEMVPPPTQGASQIDLFDFGDMAAQFNNSHIADQVSQIVPLPSLPKEDRSQDLPDPSTFLNSTSEHTTQVKSNLILENQGDSYTVYFSNLESPLFENANTPREVDLSDGPYYREFASSGMIDIENRFFANDGDHSVIVIVVPGYEAMTNFDIESGYAYDFGGNFAEDFEGDLAFNGNNAEGAIFGKAGAPREAIPGWPGNPWETPAPPTAHGPNVMDGLRMAANAFYQELFDGNDTDTNSTIDIGKQTSTPIDDSPQTTSFTQQNTDDEGGTYEDGFLLSLLGGSDGTIDELDRDQLALLKSQDSLDAASIEIEGIMNTNPEELIVDTEASTGEEGGMIDFSTAMNWAQNPVMATAEGIVEAGIQQDDKVAFEGSYGRGQTFELATVEEEGSVPDDSAVKEISTTLLNDLNKTPLDTTNTKENLDKTDASPTTHEMALEQVTNEMDYASILPTNTLSWVTFAYVGQYLTRHPNEQKKKKK